MKKYLLLFAELIICSHIMAQIPTIVEDLAIYNGNDATVFNKADNKFYKYNNLGQYEMYGVYEVVDFTAPQVTEVEYITNAENSDLFIGDYCIKYNTRVVAVVEVQSTADVPTGVFGSRENINGNYPNAFCFETVNASTLQAKLGNEAQFSTNGMSYVGVKSVFDLNGLKGESNVYVAGNTIATHSWTTWTKNYDYKYMLTFFGVRENNTSCFDYQPAGTKLYGAKIYEDTTLVMDLTPVVTITGKGGLKDRLSGTIYTNGNGIISASGSYNASASNRGVSTYKGKLVYNTADNNMYRWSGSAWESQGVGLEDISDELYFKLKNWRYPNSTFNITFQGFKEDTGERTNHNEALTCQPYFEPLWYTIGGLEAGAEYRIGFDFTTGGFSAYIPSIYYLPFFVQDGNPISSNNSWGSNNRNNTDLQTLAFIRFPFPAQDEWHIGRNFTTKDKDVTLIIQFGSCDDYIPYKFWFDNIYIQKYLYPTSYPDISLSPIEEVVDEADWMLLQLAYTEMSNGEGWNRKWVFDNESHSLSGLGGVILTEGHVTNIDLSSNNLTGTFPFALLSLPYLETLNVSGNQLAGNIGLMMTAFKQKNPEMVIALQKLDISDNKFSGNISLFANSFPSLTSLNASQNCLEDVYPAISSSVTELDLSKQTIARVVPLHLGNLSVEDIATKVPSILLYDHANQTYTTDINLLCTTADNSWGMTMAYKNGQLSIPYVSDQNTYYGESGDTLNVALLDNNGSREGSTFRIKLSFDEGDSNFDGQVNVLDLQTMINYMFEEYENKPYNFTASNLWKDEVINVQDAVSLVNILLASNSAPASARSFYQGQRQAAMSLNADATVFVADGKLVMNVAEPVSSFDIVIATSSEYKVNEALSSAGFTCSVRICGNETHLVGYSLSGATLPAGQIILGTLNDGVVIYSMLADPEANEVRTPFDRTPTSVIFISSDNQRLHEVYKISMGAKRSIVIDANGKKYMVTEK